MTLLFFSVVVAFFAFIRCGTYYDNRSMVSAKKHITKFTRIYHHSHTEKIQK